MEESASIKVQNQPKAPINNSFIAMTFLMSIMTFITAYLMIFGRYLALGYKVTAEDITHAGMQVWDLNQLFAVLTLLVAIIVLTTGLWSTMFGKVLSLGKAFLLLFAISIILFPKPFEF